MSYKDYLEQQKEKANTDAKTLGYRNLMCSICPAEKCIGKLCSVYPKSTEGTKGVVSYSRRMNVDKILSLLDSYFLELFEKVSKDTEGKIDLSSVYLEFEPIFERLQESIDLIHEIRTQLVLVGTGKLDRKDLLDESFEESSEVDKNV